MKFNNSVGLDISIEGAMKTLERLIAVHIIVGKKEGVQVHRRLSGVNKETRTLIEDFGMAYNKIFPEVETEKFKGCKTHVEE
jgi:predicted subunit of tRNA(5-methylaminomethyl-2-thiouridylate) methyltransferase